MCEDEVILERVDDGGAPVGPDQPAARTLATGLANLTFPFIRYDLGDQVVFAGRQCACGSAFARIADVGGRRDDDFRYGPILVPPIVFRHVLGTDPRVIGVPGHPDPDGADILVVGAPDIRSLDHRSDRRTARVRIARPGNPNHGGR